MKNYSVILIEKLQKYHSYDHAKLISTNILQVKKYCLLIEKIIEQAKFTYSPLGEAFGKLTKNLKIKEENKLML